MFFLIGKINSGFIRILGPAVEFILQFLLFERSKPEPAAHGCIFLPLFDFRKHILVFDRAEHVP